MFIGHEKHQCYTFQQLSANTPSPSPLLGAQMSFSVFLVFCVQKTSSGLDGENQTDEGEKG